MSEYRLECADAHEFIKTLPDASVDALITDPPYGTTQLVWDKKAPDWAALWPLIYQKCKPSAVQVVFSAQPATTDLINSNRKRFRYEVIWRKSRASNFLDCHRRPLRNHENILLFSEGQGTYNPQMGEGKPYVDPFTSTTKLYGARGNFLTVNKGERFPLTVVDAGSGANGNKLHESQKPLELLTYLVKTYTNPGDTVLDLFMGSGTTGHACILTGRNFIGCEIDSTYYETAKRRLEAAAANVPLFTPT